jgi:hypothetical protein
MAIDRKTVSAVMKEMGSRGGKKGGRKGGKAAAANMTPAERKARAQKAIETRWEKVRKEKARERKAN